MRWSSRQMLNLDTKNEIYEHLYTHSHGIQYHKEIKHCTQHHSATKHGTEHHSTLMRYTIAQRNYRRYTTSKRQQIRHIESQHTHAVHNITVQVKAAVISRGGAFPVHTDTDPGTGRSLSITIYLNDGWFASDAGELRVYEFPYGYTDVEAVWGRMVRQPRVFFFCCMCARARVCVPACVRIRFFVWTYG